MEQNFYSVVPTQLLRDRTVRDKAKLLYADLVALSNQNGYSWASNDYLSELYDVSKETVSRLLKELERSNYIKIQYERRGAEITKRLIFLSFDCQKRQSSNDENVNRTNDENVKENKTNINKLNSYITPLPPKGKTKSEESFFTCQEILDSSDLSADEKQKLGQWLQHKRERKDKYTETGFKALLTEYRNNVKQFGKDSVFKAIDQSMAGGYAGIVWDKLKNQTYNQPKIPNYDYNGDDTL